MNHKYFKTREVEERSYYLCNEAWSLMSTMVAFLLKNNVAPLITETVTTLEEDQKLKRVSSTHREGRAFDLRCKDWTPELKEKFIGFFEIHFGHLGAVREDGDVVLVVHHGVGENEHMHCQLRPSYTNEAKLAEFKSTLKKRA